jgi:NRPS condensation-like uncharacterized protein
VRPSQPQRLAAFALLTEAERRFVDEKYDLLELDEAFPLSTLQQGMIYHSLQDKSLYENVLCWFVDCEWNEKAFIKALRTVQHRHEALRSVFAIEANGRALQIVKRRLESDTRFVDLMDVACDAQERSIEEWVEAQQRRGVRLQELPWQLAVHVLSEGRFHLTLATHHALLDGWSERQLVAELLTNYRLLLTGGLPGTRSAPPSYAESVAREIEALADDAGRIFWAEQLKGASLPRWAGSAQTRNTRLSQPVGCAGKESLVCDVCCPVGRR